MSRRSLPTAQLLAPLAVLCLALTVRLLFLYSSAEQTWPHSIWYEGDAPVWVDFATALHQGVPFELGLPIRTPGVAYLLHGLQPGGPPYDLVAFKALWCVFSAVSCALAFLIFRREFGARVAWIGSALYIYSFGASVTATSLNNETPYTLLLLGIVLWTGRLERQPGIWTALGLGVLHGLATLMRAEHTLLLVLLLARSAWKGTRPALLGAAAAASVLVCLPWSLKGYEATQRFNTTADGAFDYDQAVPPWTPEARAFLESLPVFTRRQSFEYFGQLCRSAGDREVTAERLRQLYLQVFGSIPEPLAALSLASSQGALSFALANHPQSDGGFSKVGLDARWSPDPGFQPGLPSHLELYNHGYRVGLRHIAEDPVRWLKLVGLKLSIFADGVTLGFTAWNLPYGRGGIRRPVDLVTPVPGSALPWRVTFLVALVWGVWRAVRRKTGGLWLTVIAYKLIVTVLYYGYARQAVSIAPAFHVFVAVAADALWSRLRGAAGQRWEMALGSALVLGCLAAEVAHYHQREHLRVRIVGAARPAPRWGPGAFETFKQLELIPVEPRKDP